MLGAAKWIASPKDMGVCAVSFRKNISTQKPISKALIYASSMGVYALYINGKRIGNGVLAPGWTSYKSRVQYQTYDVTQNLCDGAKVEICVGQGWAVGCIGRTYTNHFYADRVSAIAKLVITYSDGTTEETVTDKAWDVYTTQVLSSDIYHGETVDKTVKCEFIGKAVETVVNTQLVSQVGEWIVERERLAPVEIIRTPKGELVVDFGQNLAGYAEITVKAPRGSRIVVHHGEVLSSDGNFYNANLRRCKNENIYVCSGDTDVFKPTFTFQGFRYIHLVEYPYDTISAEDIRAVVVHSDMKRTGYFVCGNEKINQLYHNIIWGQKSNYLDVPTDCPQRDERLGWTGDTQVFCRTGAINFDVRKFFRKWLGDMALEQREDGMIQSTVPVARVGGGTGGGTRLSAAWGDAACIVPWEIYLAYGDKEALRENFPMMKKWVNFLRNEGPEEYLWLGGMHYGDWLAMDAGEDSYVGATSNDLIASAFYAFSCQLLVKAGEALGEDVSEYRELYVRVREAFRDYFMENGMPKDDLPYTEVCVDGHAPVDTVRKGVTQTGLVLILHFGLCEEYERSALAAKLVELIEDFDMRMNTGFIGTPYLLHVLSDNGYTDIAYVLLMQEKNPSWLYSVCHGATTMWEHWNSLKEDGSFWSTDMNSFNHYAYGAVFDWIFGVVCGIKTIESAPAYKEVAIAPHPNKCLGFADTSIDTVNGTVRVYWYYKEDTVYYEINVPQGVTAHLRLPSGYRETLNSGWYHFAE